MSDVTGWRRRAVLAATVVGSAALAGDGEAAAMRRSWHVALSGGYAERLRDVATSFLAPTPERPDHPFYPSAALFAALDGAIVAYFAVGDALRYGPGKALLPLAQRRRATPNTMYDLASLTKVFTAVLVLRLVERGHLELDAPVAGYLPEFAENDKTPVTVKMLLTHTSGFPENVDLGSAPDRAGKLRSVLRSPLIARPGMRFQYADNNFIALGALVERLTGERLDALVRSEIAEPLGMRDTMYRPPRARRANIAATEDMPGRGMVLGQVHDEIAYALGGISGHAGLFGTAYDLGIFATALLRSGANRAGNGTGLLRPATVELMTTNANARLGPAAAHGLGVDLGQEWYQGRLTGPGTFGHTGFTGTSLVVDPTRRAVLVLLTNRVHPDRSWGSINVARRGMADILA